MFEKPILTNLNTVDAIVCAACALHNWLRKKSGSYIDAISVDREDHEGNFLPGLWRSEMTALESVGIQGSNHSANAAREKREWYNNYFINEGSVSWQYSKIHSYLRCSIITHN